VRPNNIDLVRFLLSAGANVNSWSVIPGGDTDNKAALMEASEHGSHTFVSLLLSHNADPGIYC
jgi:ankyrin repeat protein